MSRPAAVTIAAGLLAIAAGTSGLLLTRHSTPALRPPPLGVATVPAPTGPVGSPSNCNSGVGWSGHSSSETRWSPTST